MKPATVQCKKVPEPFPPTTFRDTVPHPFEYCMNRFESQNHSRVLGCTTTRKVLIHRYLIALGCVTYGTHFIVFVIKCVCEGNVIIPKLDSSPFRMDRFVDLTQRHLGVCDGTRVGTIFEACHLSIYGELSSYGGGFGSSTSCTVFISLANARLANTLLGSKNTYCAILFAALI